MLHHVRGCRLAVFRVGIGGVLSKGSIFVCVGPTYTHGNGEHRDVNHGEETELYTWIDFGEIEGRCPCVAGACSLEGRCEFPRGHRQGFHFLIVEIHYYDQSTSTKFKAKRMMKRIQVVLAGKRRV